MSGSKIIMLWIVIPSMFFLLWLFLEISLSGLTIKEFINLIQIIWNKEEEYKNKWKNH